MKETEIQDQRIARISDLLQQITSVDEMIALHEKKKDDRDLMLLHYQSRRSQFLAERKKTLEQLNIDPTGLIAA